MRRRPEERVASKRKGPVVQRGLAQNPTNHAPLRGHMWPGWRSPDRCWQALYFVSKCGQGLSLGLWF